MTFSVLLQVFVDLVLLAMVGFLWVKMIRPQKDDPRLSRGLQLLQSKIAVLEDLSDQVETQVQQITALIEAKGREVQTQITAAEKQIAKIQESMNKSLEVAQIFQDRIPHQEIIERQNTVKYVKAARLAHGGASLDEIAEQVDLSRGELELIAKVNKEQLQFSEEDLPEWAKKDSGPETLTDANVAAENFAASLQGELESQPLARAQDKVQVSLSSLGERFRQALPSDETTDLTATAPAAANSRKGPSIEMPAKPTPPPSRETATTTSGKSVEIQKVIFPRVDMTDHLS